MDALTAIQPSSSISKVLIIVLAKRSVEEEKTHIKIAKLVMVATTDYFNVTKSAIESKSRDTDVRMARQIFMVLTKKFTTLSFAKVGAIIGKDHSTVMHSEKVVNNQNDPIHEHFLIIQNRVERALLTVEVESKKAGQL